MKKNPIIIFLIVMAITLACGLSGQSLPAPTATSIPATATLAETFTPIPTFTITPTITPIPGTVVLDFAARLCDSKWMNGGQKFEACPDPIGDTSKGYATLIDPSTEGLPANAPVILTIPALNNYSALFLRYPTLTIQASDHFRATLRCQTAATNCDVNFGLDYYDSNGKYHSPLAMWDYKAGQAPISADFDLSTLAGQNVDIVLALRPNNNMPEQDLGLWIAPQIFRPGK